MTMPSGWQPRPMSYALPMHRPRLTWIILAAIVVVFLAETAAGGSTRVDVLIRLGAKVTPLIDAGQYWRLFTAMFLHIGTIHLFFNAYALFAVGTELERLFGSPRFAATYFLSGLLGSLASYAFSYSLAAGASGAIFGLIGALAAFFLLYRDRLGAWGRARLANIAFLVVINLFLGFTQPGIDNLGHIGGLLGGLGLGWALAPRYQLDSTLLRPVDRNHLGRYWPALLLAAVVLVAGTAVAARAHQSSPQLSLFRGRQAIEREEWNEAAAEFEQVLARDPSLADASLYFLLGLARNHLGQPQLAAQAYEAALALDANDSSSHWNLALTYLEIERYANARQHFEAYLELNPDKGYRVDPYLNMLQKKLSGG